MPFSAPTTHPAAPCNGSSAIADQRQGALHRRRALHTHRHCLKMTGTLHGHPTRAAYPRRESSGRPAAPTHSGDEQQGPRPRRALAPAARTTAHVRRRRSAGWSARLCTSSGSVPRLDHGTETLSSSAKARSTVVAPPAGMKAACDAPQVRRRVALLALGCSVRTAEVQVQVV